MDGGVEEAQVKRGRAGGRKGWSEEKVESVMYIILVSLCALGLFKYTGFFHSLLLSLLSSSNPPQP